MEFTSGNLSLSTRRRRRAISVRQYSSEPGASTSSEPLENVEDEDFARQIEDVLRDEDTVPYVVEAEQQVAATQGQHFAQQFSQAEAREREASQLAITQATHSLVKELASSFSAYNSGGGALLSRVEALHSQLTNLVLENRGHI